MGQFFNSIKNVTQNYNKFDDWEQRQADERAKKEYLAEHIDIPQDELDLINKKAQTIVRATEIMDAKSEDNCENMEQYTSLIATIPLIAISILMFPMMQAAPKLVEKYFNNKIFKLKQEVGLEKLSNFEAKNLLCDINKKQYNKLEKLINARKTKMNKAPIYVQLLDIILTLGIGIGATLWGTKKQKEASRIGRYQAKQNELRSLENFIIYTPEQLAKAKEIAKNIPDKKEANELKKILKGLNQISKDKQAYKEWLKAQDPQKIEKLKQIIYTPEQLAKGEQEKELIVNIVKEINIKAEEYSENLENAFDTLSTLSWLLSVPVGMGINKLMKFIHAPKKLKTAISFIIPFIVSLGISIHGTVEQKKASRVGRFQARKDLLNNLARLRAYSDEEMKKAEQIKAPKQKKGFFEKIGQNFKFLRTYWKDKKEYNEYKEKIQKENEKLQQAFKKINITEEQKAEAKTLQKNVFTAFDEIDEMSQRYSEDVEAGCDIAKLIGMTAWELGVLAASSILAITIVKGKFPFAKVINGITNLSLKKESSLRKAINNLYDILKKDKESMKDFNQDLIRGKIDFSSVGDDSKSKALKNLYEEFSKIVSKGVTPDILKGEKDIKLTKILGALFDEHLKQGRLAKWSRNILGEISKLWMKSNLDKIEDMGMMIPDDITKTLGMNFSYNNYKTLINTGLFAGVPILGTIFAVPYAFNAWLTNIQKKSGKIGIMKAMDKIDDPRVFASQDEKPSAQSVKQKIDNNFVSTNLLDKYRS